MRIRIIQSKTTASPPVHVHTFADSQACTHCHIVSFESSLGEHNVAQPRRTHTNAPPPFRRTFRQLTVTRLKYIPPPHRTHAYRHVTFASAPIKRHRQLVLCAPPPKPPAQPARVATPRLCTWSAMQCAQASRSVQRIAHTHKLVLSSDSVPSGRFSARIFSLERTHVHTHTHAHKQIRGHITERESWFHGIIPHV